MVLRTAIGLLRRFKFPQIMLSSTISQVPVSKSFSCQYGSPFATLRKHQTGMASWTLLYGQAALFLGINVTLAFAEDVPGELGTEKETGEAGIPGIRRIEDGSVVSNKHTSRWWLYTKMAREKHEQGNLKEAERYFLLALEEAKQGFGERDPHVASACNNLAELYKVSKAFDKADPLYLKAVNILEESYGPDDIRVGAAFDNLGQFYLVQQKLEESRLSYERALKIKGQILGHGHTDYADTLYHLGRVLYLQGKENDSEALIRESIKILEEAGQEESITCLRRLRYISQICKKSSRFSEAENIQRKILHVLELSKGWNYLDTVNAAEDLALTLQSIGSLKEAQELLERCLAVRKTELPEDHIQIGANMLRMARVAMLNSSKLMKVDFSEASTELDKAKTLLNNSVRIAQYTLNTLKAKRSSSKNSAKSKRIMAKDEHTALFILLQSFIALGLLEITKQGLQEPKVECPHLAEAANAFRQCTSAFKEAAQSGVPKSICDSPEVKGEYLSCLKHLLYLMRKGTGDSPHQFTTLQELEDEIRITEAELEKKQK